MSAIYWLNPLGRDEPDIIGDSSTWQGVWWLIGPGEEWINLSVSWTDHGWEDWYTFPQVFRTEKQAKAFAERWEEGRRGLCLTITEAISLTYLETDEEPKGQR